VADITFCALLKGAATPVTLLVRGAKSTRSGPFDYFLDTNNDGASDGAASKFGILVAAAFGNTPLAADGAHLVVQIAVPLAGTGPTAIFCNDPLTPNRMQATFYQADGTVLSVSDALVKINSDLSTFADSGYVPGRIAIEIKNFINLNKEGLVPVTILSTAEFNAMTVNPDSVRLMDPKNVVLDYLNDVALLPGTSQKAYTRGAKPVKSNLRLGGNGRVDLVLYFSSTDLKNAGLGGFTRSTTQAFLAGFTTDNTPIAGEGGVVISNQ
jgi:hypothetical protein